MCVSYRLLIGVLWVALSRAGITNLSSGKQKNYQSVPQQNRHFAEITGIYGQTNPPSLRTGFDVSITL